VPPPPEDLDHRMPPTEPPPPMTSSRLEISVPLKNHKPDYRTWAVALLGPRVRRCTTSNELADLLGANEENLERVRVPGAIPAADLGEMERIIAERWQALPA
jgi:hypothetical protein